jgi:nitrogen regulatory protein P-II 1
MKEIKAFIHRNRAADVIRALKGAGYGNLSVVDVKGMLAALDERERDYSIELGEETITEVKLELVCEDGRADEAVRLIRENGRTGQPEAGWVYVSEVIGVCVIDETQQKETP